MTIKINRITRGLLAALSFWVAALALAILVAILMLHLLIAGENPALRLLQP